MHPPLAQAAHRSCAQHRVLACTRPYSGPLPDRVAPVPGLVATRKRALARHVVASCRAGPRRVVALPAVLRASCSVSWQMLGRIAALLRSLSQPVSRYTQQPSHPPIKIRSFVSRHPPNSQAMRSPLRVGRLCHSVVSCPWLAVSQPCCPPPPPPPPPEHTPTRPYRGVMPLPCHDTICCIVTKAGKWAVAHPAARKPFFFFFSLIIFFSFVPAIVRPQIYIYIYFHVFSIIKKIFFFKYFFSCFTHCKTNRKKKKKNSLNIIFFPMCYLPSTQTTQHTQ